MPVEAVTNRRVQPEDIPKGVQTAEEALIENHPAGFVGRVKSWHQQHQAAKTPQARSTQHRFLYMCKYVQLTGQVEASRNSLPGIHCWTNRNAFWRESCGGSYRPCKTGCYHQIALV